MIKKTKYMTIIHWVIEQITTEAVLPGDKLHSENILCELFDVSRQTVRRAFDELESMGYITRIKGSGTYVAKNYPNSSSKKGNKKDSSKVVGIITTYLDDFVFPSIIQGIETVLTKQGFLVQVMSTKDCMENEIKAFQTLSEKALDGLIVWPTKSALPRINQDIYKQLTKKDLPIVFLDSCYPEFPQTYVAVDDESIGFIATKHLIDMGHRNIMGIFPYQDRLGHLRYKGYANALLSAGLPLKSSNIHWYCEETVEEDTNKPSFWESIDKCSAAFCFNDIIALMIIDQLKHKGILVPDDFSIVGVDNTLMGQRSELTSVTHPGAKLGEKVAELLVSMIHGKKGENIIFPAELVKRNSVKKISRKG